MIIERAVQLTPTQLMWVQVRGDDLATANAVLQEIEDSDLLANATARGEQLRTRILGLGSPLVTEVRGRGLLLGIGLSKPVSKQIAAEAMRRGLIVNAPNPSSIRLAPPLIVGDTEIDEFITLFRQTLEAVA